MYNFSYLSLRWWKLLLSSWCSSSKLKLDQLPVLSSPILRFSCWLPSDSVDWTSSTSFGLEGRERGRKKKSIRKHQILNSETTNLTIRSTKTRNDIQSHTSGPPNTLYLLMKRPCKSAPNFKVNWAVSVTDPFQALHLSKLSLKQFLFSLGPRQRSISS